MTLHTLGLSELVNFTTDESHEQLLGKGVFYGFALKLSTRKPRRHSM